MLLIEGGEEGGTKDSQPWGWEPRDDSCHQGFVYQASLPQAPDQMETANSISPSFSSSILPSSSWPAQHSCWVTRDHTYQLVFVSPGERKAHNLDGGEREKTEEELL